MMAVRQILFATDFSACSEHAARVAQAYARQLGGRLHLYHVDWPASDPVAASLLQRLAGDLGRDVPVVTVMESGIPAAELIVKYAARHGIELIVMGTHGRTGFSRALIGSVAERVVRTASCPVLTVSCRVREEQAPPVPEADRDRRQCLVCARPSDDLICEPCRAHVRGEAIERKQRAERAGR